MINLRTLLILLLCLVAPLEAQEVTVGQLEGTIREPMRARSANAASITLARLEPEPISSYAVKPDNQGRFRLDSLPAGRYMIQLTNELIDSLELSLPINEVTIVAGATVQAHFSLPTSTALRNAVCHGLPLSARTGAVFGRVSDADTERPLENADVAISWKELGVDRATLRTTTEEHTGWVRTGARGEYRICNVPIGSWVLIQLQYAGRAGNAVRVSVLEEEGVIVRNMSLSVLAAPTLARLDSVGGTVRGLDSEQATTDTIAELDLTGSSAVSGVVTGFEGRPLGDVEVRVLNARPTTRSDDAGRFTLNGLPAGTQLLAVRRIGYLIGDVAVELRPGRTTRQNVQLRRVVSLDSIRVVARRSRYAEFEYNRKNSPVGNFLVANDIARWHAMELGAVIQHLAGFSIVGSGPDARVYSNRAKVGRLNCGEANVVIDGVDHSPINFTPPREIAAIEAYPEAAGAPTQYRAECGLVVIWTKKWRAIPPT